MRRSVFLFAWTIVLASICLIGSMNHIAYADTAYVDEAGAYISEYKTITEAGTAPAATTPGYENWLFAGWYATADCSSMDSAIRNADISSWVGKQAYAKFVPSDLLVVKVQFSTGITAGTAKTNMRMVSSIDTLHYASVGFKVVFHRDDGTTVARTIAGTSVYSKIKASAASGIAFEYNPKAFDAEAEWFITATVTNIYQASYDNNFVITPYWVTLDGTRVNGQTRYVQVQDAYTDVVPLTVKAANQAAVDAFTVSGKTIAQRRYYGGEEYATLMVSQARSTLASLTSYSIQSGGQTVQTVAYRNLGSSWGTVTNQVPAGDQTWYTANPGKDEYVIANAPDLYGLAELVNNNTQLFAGKTIYLASSITLDGDTYHWNPIGTWSRQFKGTFDGCGQTICGIHAEGTTCVGLFGVTGAGSTVGNFRLTNGYFKGTQIVGSVVGRALGSVESIYSDAMVVASANYGHIGGIVGQAWDTAIHISNCWFGGSITCSSEGFAYAGGILGENRSTAVRIEHCLYSGSIVSASNRNNPVIGGINGSTNEIAEMTKVMDCLSVGTLEADNSGAKGYIASLIGSAPSGNAVVENSYGTAECWGNAATWLSTASVAGQMPESELSGQKGYTNTSLDFTGYWAVISGGTPELRQFARGTVLSPSGERVYTSWYDSTLGKTFIITTKEQLFGFAHLSKSRTFSTQTIKLGADLALNQENAATWDNASNAPETLWTTPIGSSAYPFAGTFDGQGYTISGLYINAPTTDQIGMFGRVASSAVIKNFELRNSYVCGGNLSGAVIGRSDGCTVESVYTDAVFTSTKQCVGGIVGSTWDGETVVRNCWFAGVMTLTHATPYAGGIVGENRDGTLTVENCLFTGSITASTAGNGKRLGGIVGSALGPGKEGDGATVRYCLATGTMTSNSGNHSYEGPIVGLVEIPAKVTVSDCYATTTTGYSYLYTHSSGYGYEVGSTVAPGQLTGANGYVNTTLDFKDAKYWVAKNGGTPELTQFSTGMALDLAEVHRPDTSWYDTTANKTFELTTKEQLLGFAQLSWQYDFKTQTIKLGADIFINKGDASAWGTQAPESVWTPIGTSSKPFAGTFDGQNHTVSGLYVRSSASDLGLFGSVSGTIRNMRLDNSYLEQTGAGDAGSIVGNLSGNLSNVYSNAMVVTSYSQAGGVIGQVSGGTYTLQDVWYDGAIWLQKGATHAGGIIGDVTGGTWTLQNCLFTGSLDSDLTNGSTYGYVGGVCGSVYSAAQLTLDACVSTGTIRTSNKDYGIGAFVGGLKSGASTLTMTNIFAARDAGFREVGVENDVTVIGKTVWVTASDRLVGYCQEDTDASYSGARLHFPTNWIIRKEGTPVPATFSDRVTEVAASTLNTAIGLDQWKSFASHSLSDAVHYGAGKYVLRFGSSSNDSKSTYTTYVNYLKDTLGFTEYQKNTWDQLENGIYTKKDGDWVLDVLHTDDTGETIITIRTGIEKTLSPNLSSAYAAQEGAADITLTMMPLRGAWAAGNATHGGEGTLLYYYGQSFVFQLPNGHFVLNDGGMRPYDGRCPDLENLIAYLKLLAGTDSSGRQKPVRIDAWTISHQHDDHAGALEGFALYPYLAADVTVEAIYVNEPNNRVMDYLDSTQSPYINVQHRGMRALKTEEGMPTPVYSYQTGEEYWFNGLTMRVIQSQELIPTSDYETRNMSGKIRGDLFNTVSTVLLFTTAGDEKILISGDANLTNMAYIMSAYGANPTILDGIDVFQAFHHGKNTSYSFTWSSNIFTDYLTDEAEKDFKVVLFPCSKVYGIDENTSFGVYFPHAEACNQYIINNCIAAGGGYYTWKHDGEPDEVIIVTFTAGGITHGSYAIADLVSPMDSPAVSNPGGITFGDPDEIIPGGWD